MLYQPPHFRVEDEEHALTLMRAHPLATLISTAAAGEPPVSHVPLLAARSADGLVLTGHLARPNPQWKAWRDGDAVLAVFHGPQAYVSPAWYATAQAVPTWNYAVVHAAGTVTMAHDSETKELVLKALIDAHDPPYHAQWDALDVAWREQMKAGIVAFRIAVTRLDAKFKVAQNRSAADRAGVLDALQRGGEQARALADWTRRLAPDR